jgi:aspartate/methionine/tyrosine aminotransferase
MHWAKARSQARFNLATSGIASYSLADLGAGLADLEINGPTGYGYEPLRRTLARKCGVEPECVVAGTGASGANHLALAALLAPGDEVVMERPVYEPVESLARHLGAEIRFFERRAETGFRVEPEAVARQVTARTRAIVLTNLHNPSGALTDAATLREVGEIARGAGARVVVDEVYIEMLWVEGDRASIAAAGGAGRSSFHLGSEFVVTDSLTKAYGLSGLRCGWILAEPELAERMWRLNDLFGVNAAHPAERLSVLALQRLDQAADRAKEILARNRALLHAFLDGRDDLELHRPEYGTVIFPRWRGGDTEPLCRLLREKYETTVVPGRFFGMPEHFRVGIGGDREMLEGGLERLGAALDELGRD